MKLDKNIQLLNQDRRYVEQENYYVLVFEQNVWLLIDREFCRINHVYIGVKLRLNFNSIFVKYQKQKQQRTKN